MTLSKWNIRVLVFCGLASMACQGGGAFSCCGSGDSPTAAQSAAKKRFKDLAPEQCYQLTTDHIQAMPQDEWTQVEAKQLVALKLTSVQSIPRNALEVLWNRSELRSNPVSDAELRAIIARIRTANPTLTDSDIDAERFSTLWEDRLSDTQRRF